MRRDPNVRELAPLAEAVDRRGRGAEPDRHLLHREEARTRTLSPKYCITGALAFDRTLANSGESIRRAASELPSSCEPLLSPADRDLRSRRAWGASGRWFKSSRPDHLKAPEYLPISAGSGAVFRVNPRPVAIVQVLGGSEFAGSADAAGICVSEPTAGSPPLNGAPVARRAWRGDRRSTSPWRLRPSRVETCPERPHPIPRNA